MQNAEHESESNQSRDLDGFEGMTLGEVSVESHLESLGHRPGPQFGCHGPSQYNVSSPSCYPCVTTFGAKRLRAAQGRTIMSVMVV